MAIGTAVAMRNARANSGRRLPDATQLMQVVEAVGKAEIGEAREFRSTLSSFAIER